MGQDPEIDLDDFDTLFQEEIEKKPEEISKVTKKEVEKVIVEERLADEPNTKRCDLSSITLSHVSEIGVESDRVISMIQKHGMNSDAKHKIIEAIDRIAALSESLTKSIEIHRDVKPPPPSWFAKDKPALVKKKSTERL